jgi:hypothetical protein|nr:MAG TPA: hypothetical protein [Caudoviricetes sp.]
MTVSLLDRKTAVISRRETVTQYQSVKSNQGKTAAIFYTSIKKARIMIRA